jgi:hypothetical protein
LVSHGFGRCLLYPQKRTSELRVAMR